MPAPSTPLRRALLGAACALSVHSAGCSSPKGSDTADVDTGSDVVHRSLEAAEVFRVPERAWDLAASDDGRVWATAQGGGKIYAWTPGTVPEERDEITDDVGGVRAIGFIGDAVWVTTSDFGVEGTLSLMDGRFASPQLTQADDGTLLRDPVDLCPLPGGGWLIADSAAGGLFEATADGSSATFHDGGSAAPQVIAFFQSERYVGAEDGVWRLAPGVDAAELIDPRPALGLVEVSGELWAAGPEDGLFVVGGGSLGAEVAARPASLMLSGGLVYMADRVGEAVWAIDPTSDQ